MIITQSLAPAIANAKNAEEYISFVIILHKIHLLILPLIQIITNKMHNHEITKHPHNKNTEKLKSKHKNSY